MNSKNMLYEATENNIKRLIDHLQLKAKTFNRQDIIVNPSSDKNMIGIIISGMAYLTTINLNYQKRILDYYEVNDIFNNRTLANLGNNSYYIYAKTKCSVVFLDLRELQSNSNDTMDKFQDYMLDKVGRRTLQHIDILSQLTLRNKLLSYFDYCKKSTQSTRFILPLTLTDLADYLAVDRSAMMRELGKMREEKIIQSNGRNITILDYKFFSK
jgi:CRP-like cAMP-binding protein